MYLKWIRYWSLALDLKPSISCSQRDLKWAWGLKTFFVFCCCLIIEFLNCWNLSSGIASTQNEDKSFSLSFRGIFLNQPVEFDFNQTEANISVFFKNVKSGKKTFFQLIRTAPSTFEVIMILVCYLYNFLIVLLF